MVVEDDENVRDAVSLLLNYAGYELATCYTGRHIFNTIEKLQPQLILLDILLGEMNRRDICKAIKNNRSTSNIPVIIITSMQNVYNAISEEGANDVVAKPFTEAILLGRIQGQLSGIRN